MKRNTTNERIKNAVGDLVKFISTPILGAGIYYLLTIFYQDLLNGILFANIFNIAITGTASLAFGNLLSKIIFIRGTIQTLGDRFDNEKPEGAGHIDVVRTVNDKTIKGLFSFPTFLASQAVAIGLLGTIMGLSSATNSLSTAMSGVSELSKIKDAIAEMLSVGLSTAFDSTLLAMSALIVISTVVFIFTSVLMKTNSKISHEVEFRGYKPGQE